jgi:glycosyltransferase involved in cell wall biosynthesis
MGENKPLQAIMLGAGLEVMGGISSVEKLILEQGIPNVNLKHIPTLEEGSVIKKILVFKRAIADLLLTLCTNEIDLIHIHFSSRGSTFRAIILIVTSLLFQKPIILHAHGSGFDIFYSNIPLWLKKTINYFFGKCSYFITLSNSWKKFYVTNVEIEEDRIVVLPNPVKIPLFKRDYARKSNNIKFLFLGRIGQRKGAFELIEAFSHLPLQQRTQASLVMAGDGEIEKAKKLVRDLELSDRINILDWVNSQERDALLSRSDIFVLPSHNEGLPMAIIEAMSFGLSIITTPVGGIPELIYNGDNGLLTEPGNIKELSDAMLHLIDNEGTRNSLGTKAKKRVASLDIKKYCSSLMSIYQSVHSNI